MSKNGGGVTLENCAQPRAGRRIGGQIGVQSIPSTYDPIDDLAPRCWVPDAFPGYFMSTKNDFQRFQNLWVTLVYFLVTTLNHVRRLLSTHSETRIKEKTRNIQKICKICVFLVLFRSILVSGTQYYYFLCFPDIFKEQTSFL